MNGDGGSSHHPLPPGAMRSALRPAIAVTALTVVGGLLVYALAPMHGPRAWLGLVVGLIAVGIVVPVTVRRAQAIANSERPIVDAVQAITLQFMLLVLGFAAVYVVLSDRNGQLVDVKTKIDAVYFTLSTFGTIGFGDAHAVGQLARVVVSVQIVFDLVFLAVAVRLITVVARRRVQEQRPAD